MKELLSRLKDETPLTVGARVAAVEISGVEFPGDYLPGIITHVFENEDGARFMPDEPDPSRNNGNQNGRAFDSRYGWFVNRDELRQLPLIIQGM